MSRVRRFLPGIAAVVIVLLLGCFLGWLAMRQRHSSAPADSSRTSASVTPAPQAISPDDMAPTLVYAHNIMLRKGPDFRIYLVWISGEMVRTKRNVNPSFDEPDSFILQIQKGVIHANIGDIGKYLNSVVPADAPLKNMDIQPDGELVKIRGTFKKVVPLPVEIVGSLAATPDGLVRLHAQHISVLKVPVKGLLGTVDVKLADLVHSTNVPGVTVSGNDIIFDTEKLLPPPHIRGKLTTVQVKVPDIEVIYGNAPNDPTQLAQWHNFLRFRNGAFDFGKLTMHHADLTMIDAAKEPWFDLDLVNYQNQFVNGYTRMTAQAGLEIYMPSLKAQTPKQAGPSVTLQWLKNRNASLPPDVAEKTKIH
ncbi:MAG TPA: hypothetical protein VGG66_10680 [Rhizomicrobium sp.]